MISLPKAFHCMKYFLLNLQFLVIVLKDKKVHAFLMPKYNTKNITEMTVDKL